MNTTPTENDMDRIISTMDGHVRVFAPDSDPLYLQSMGRAVRITAIASSIDAANTYVALNPGQSAIRDLSPVVLIANGESEVKCAQCASRAVGTDSLGLPACSERIPGLRHTGQSVTRATPHLDAALEHLRALRREISAAVLAGEPLTFGDQHALVPMSDETWASIERMIRRAKQDKPL